MKIRGLAILLATAVIGGCLTGCGSTETASSANNEYQKIELVMAVNGTDIQIDTKVADKFAELVAEASDGNVQSLYIRMISLQGATLPRELR